MSNPQIQFTPDRYSYAPGQKGKVIIRTFEDLEKCSKIILSLNRGGKRVRSTEVLRIEYEPEDKTLRKEQDYTLYFSIPVDIPLSFKGKKIKITYEWHLQFDIPWAFDIKHSYAMKIRPGVLKSPLASLIPTTSVSKKGQRFWERFFKYRAGTIFFIIFFSIFFINFLIFIPEIIITLFAAVALYFPVRNFLRSRIIQDYSIYIPRRQWAMGETIPISIVMKHRKELPLNSITAKLTATEFADKGKKIIASTLYNHSETITGSKVVPASSRAYTELTHGLRIPVGIPSLEKVITWDLKIKVDIPGYPDINWQNQLEIICLNAQTINRN